MCVSREHFNLCKCGCPEIVHEENPLGFLDPFGVFDFPQMRSWVFNERGRCLGDIPLNLSIDEIRKLIDEAKARGEERPALTKPCDCKKFDPVFKNECGGMGAGESDLLGRKLG